MKEIIGFAPALGGILADRFAMWIYWRRKPLSGGAVDLANMADLLVSHSKRVGMSPKQFIDEKSSWEQDLEKTAAGRFAYGKIGLAALNAWLAYEQFKDMNVYNSYAFASLAMAYATGAFFDAQKAGREFLKPWNLL